MNYEDKKIVAILATNVDPKTAMNVIGHLAISIGKYSDNEIMGKKELIDNSGIGHLGISKFPFVVTKVKASRLKNTINVAKQNPNIMVADYPKEMLETRTDEELVEAIGIKKEEKIIDGVTCRTIAHGAADDNSVEIRNYNTFKKRDHNFKTGEVLSFYVGRPSFHFKALKSVGFTIEDFSEGICTEEAKDIDYNYWNKYHEIP